MGLFSCRRPDPDLQALDASSAQRIRGLVSQSLDALGIDAMVVGDHVDSSLGEFSLEPVARECADQDRKAWPLIVDEMVKRMVRSLVDGARQLSDATIGEHVVWRLLPDAERMGRSFRYARAVPGEGAEDVGAGSAEEAVPSGAAALVVALAWDGEDSLDLLNDSALAEVHDLDAAFAAGRRNLRADLDAAPVEVSRIGVEEDSGNESGGDSGAGSGAAGGLLELSSPSWLTASWALLAEDVAARFLSAPAARVLLGAADHQHLLVGPASDAARAAMVPRLGDTPVLRPTIRTI